jgi:hypothetical protein
MAYGNRTQQNSERSSTDHATVRRPAKASSRGSTHLLLQRAYADPASLTAKDVKHLHRTVGNQATIDLLSRSTTIQTKLKLGPAGDQYEQEADRVASQVVRQMDGPHSVQRQGLEEEELQMKPLAATVTSVQRKTLQKPTVQRENLEEEELQMKPRAGTVNTLQRKDESRPKTVFTKPGEETSRLPKPPAATISRVQRMADPQFTKSFFIQRQGEEEELQMKPMHGPEGGAVEQSVEKQIQTARGGGKPLDDNVRGSMEKGFGADFSGVRVHMGGQADALNRLLNAKAFTVGNDVFFGQGQYNPGSSGGQELLAHELAHTVQQGAVGIQRYSRIVSVTPAQSGTVQRRTTGEISEDVRSVQDSLRKAYLRPTYSALKLGIEGLEDLKEEAEAEGYADIVREVDTALGSMAGLIGERLYGLSEDERKDLLRQLSFTLGNTTAIFSSMAVGLYSTGIGGKAQGGEFLDPTMQEKERAERRRLRIEAGLDPGTGTRDDKEDIEPDFEAQVRVNLLAEAMVTAYQGYLTENATRGDVLPVFEAPEWFFRRSDRPYLPAEKDQVVNLLASVSASFPNMLIVAGTILWAEGLDNPGVNGTNIKLYNTAPIVMNGRLQKLYDKKNEGGDTSGYESLNIGLGNWTRGDSSNIFNISNVKFAIDICADTADGQAKQNYYAQDPEGKLGGTGVDVHLITSNGSPAANAIARPGGYILHSDSSKSPNQAPTGLAKLHQAESLPADTMPLAPSTSRSRDDVSPISNGIYRGTVDLPAVQDLTQDRTMLDREAEMVRTDLTSSYHTLLDDLSFFSNSDQDHRFNLIKILAWARANQPPAVANANKLLHARLVNVARGLGDEKPFVTPPGGRTQQVPLKPLASYVISQLEQVVTRFDPIEVENRALDMTGYRSLKQKVGQVKDSYQRDAGGRVDREQAQLVDMLAYALYHLRQRKSGRRDRVQGMIRKLDQIVMENSQNLGPHLELAMYTKQRLLRVKT